MKPRRDPLSALLLPIAALLFAPAAFGQAAGEMDAAHKDGIDTGKTMRSEASSLPDQQPTSDTIPGFQGTPDNLGNLFGSDDKALSAAAGGASSVAEYGVVRQGDANKSRVPSDQLTSIRTRGDEINAEPGAFALGIDANGQTGTCREITTETSPTEFYEATCNIGAKVEDVTRTCSITMAPEVSSTAAYKYYVVPDSAYGTPFARYASIQPYVSSGVCKPTGVSKMACAAHVDYGWTPANNKYCDDYSATEYECTADLDIAAAPSPKTGKSWHVQSSTTTVTTKRVDGCGALAGDTMCTQQSAEDVCTQGPETRIINGVPVTEACWAWQRSYTCHQITQATDCGDFEADPKCTFLRDECLDEDPSGGACKTTEQIYSCPVPVSTAPQKEYVCGGDIYCVNGVCQEIERDASDELKDALVAMGAMDQAQKEFDPDNLSLFKGARETCHQPIFGLVNCCAGKVSGLLTTAAGLSALAGGPAVLAGVATQFLTLFLCSTQEKMLDVKDRMGLCHFVGSYCSSSFLGICSTKRKTYCCFQSKLTRILQEQGRPQIGKPWDKPKTEQCLGFTIDEFSRLDLSKMDFTEIYAEFLEAAKLPDEAQMAADIQTKIRAYYQENAAASTGGQ
ncbi:conjugal transfer protein TraN [Novosphingobium sp. G106]|uniref:conjugal transfer protein TraN n=1 Tax=Novosphingobium sp. G106 TaxID=2849500 RepID=UPI002810EE66|nr:conjugal transfer protein TraN [Novosphingobium sp. G106]